MESANVVGYQEKNIVDSNVGGFTWALATLSGVGENREEMKLSSWKITAPEGGLWSEVSVLVNTFDAEGQIDGAYVYLDEVQGATYSVEPGWYTSDSVAAWAPESANDVLIPFGTGVQIGSDCGATVTFSGEVASGDVDITINDSAAGGYTWTGNCSPVDLTLADLAITAPEGGLWSEVSVLVNTFDAEGQIDGAYVYLDEVQGATYSVEPGWYTSDSVAAWAPESAGSVDIDAGEMFQIGSDCGAVISIPSAIK